ncbi:hypothetical protein BJV77DRAFT_194915 [Russula vinacea]|nr:hypothetical protein BJV77DRAFT_194915 [Russula vinacea]
MSCLVKSEALSKSAENLLCKLQIPVDTDPIPMGCLVKSEALSKSTEKSQLGGDTARHSNCNALNHPQPFDARKRIPVFLATAQAQILVPKSSDNYTSISYDHSVTSVVSSNVTLSSGLSTPLPIIDYKPCNESKTNSFSNLLKKLYRDISHLEEMMLLVDSVLPMDCPHHHLYSITILGTSSATTLPFLPFLLTPIPLSLLCSHPVLPMNCPHHRLYLITILAVRMAMTIPFLLFLLMLIPLSLLHSRPVLPMDCPRRHLYLITVLTSLATILSILFTLIPPSHLRTPLVLIDHPYHRLYLVTILVTSLRRMRFQMCSRIFIMVSPIWR